MVILQHPPAISRYRQSRRDTNLQNNGRSLSPSAADQRKTEKCPDCSNSFHIFNKKAYGWNQRPHRRCESCWKKRRNSSKKANENASMSSNADDFLGQVTAIENISPSISSPISQNKEIAILDHHIFNKGEWRKIRITEHPQVSLSLSIDKNHKILK